MIRTTGLDSKDLNTGLQQLENHLEIIYRPWKEYLSLSPGQKRTIVMEQHQFIKQNKTFFITQLNTKHMDVPMFSTEEGETLMIEHDLSPHNQTECDLTQISIVDFLRNHYKACDGKNLFSFLYTPIEDEIEVMVQKKHAVEAEECLDDIKQGLMYFCNKASREKVFHNILIQEIDLRHYKPWRPFQWSKRVPSYDVPDKVAQSKRKRLQFQAEPHQQEELRQVMEPIPTYASIAKQKQLTSDGAETLITQTSEITTLMGDGLLEFKLQQTCEMMQQNMQYQEERMGQLEQQLITQTREAAIQVEQRFAEATRTMEQKIAESALKQEVILNDHLANKCSSMMSQIEALFIKNMATPMKLSEDTGSHKEDVGMKTALTPRKRTGPYCSEDTGRDTEASVTQEIN